MMKYKKGDRVVIRSDLENGECYGASITNKHGGMMKWYGETMTIIMVLEGYGYKMEEDKGECLGDGWLWTEEMIEGLALKNKGENKMKKISKTKMLKNMGVERVIFNGRATIVFLEDGTKGVAVADEKDAYDKSVGLAMAYAVAKATQGNKKQFKENVEKL